MTAREMYKECERLYCAVDWNNKESIRHYNEAVRELRKKREEEENERALGDHVWRVSGKPVV